MDYEDEVGYEELDHDMSDYLATLEAMSTPSDDESED